MGHSTRDELGLGGGAGRALLAKLDGPDPADRRWAERRGRAVVKRTVARLVRDPPADVDPDALPTTALAYALAVMLAAREGTGDHVERLVE